MMNNSDPGRTSSPPPPSASPPAPRHNGDSVVSRHHHHQYNIRVRPASGSRYPQTGTQISRRRRTPFISAVRLLLPGDHIQLSDRPCIVYHTNTLSMY